MKLERWRGFDIHFSKHHTGVIKGETYVGYPKKHIVVYGDTKTEAFNKAKHKLWSYMRTGKV